MNRPSSDPPTNDKREHNAAVVALVSDLIFGSKISATAAHLQLPIDVVRTSAAALSRLELPACNGLIVDLHCEGDALQLIRKARALRPDATVVAFVSHVQKELADAARSAGADRVLPRSKFTSELPKILQQLASR